MPSLAVGVIVTVAAGVAFNLAPLAEAVAARREPARGGVGIGLLFRLARRPLWLWGLGCEVFGFLLEVVALAIAPLTLVEPLIGVGVVLLALGANRWLGESLDGFGRIALATTVIGGLAVVVALRHRDQVGRIGSSLSLTILALVALAVAGMAVSLARWGSANHRPNLVGLGFGLAAGVCNTLSTLATHQIGLIVKDYGFWRLFSGAAVYELAIFSVLGLALLQRGYQGGAVLITYPVASTMTTALPVMAGVWLLAEPVPSGPGLALLIVALFLIVAGIVGLGRQRGVARIFAPGSPSAVAPRSTPAPRTA